MIVAFPGYLHFAIYANAILMSWLIFTLLDILLTKSLFTKNRRVQIQRWKKPYLQKNGRVQLKDGRNHFRKSGMKELRINFIIYVLKHVLCYLLKVSNSGDFRESRDSFIRAKITKKMRQILAGTRFI